MTRFENLTKKEKLEHIWEYYKWHIIGTIIGIIVISQLLITIFGPKEPRAYANIVIMGKYVEQPEKVEPFKEEMESLLGEKIDVLAFPVDWEDSSPMTVAMDQKIMLMLQAKEIDILAIEKVKFDFYMKNLESSPFLALDQIGELSDLLENHKDNILINKFIEEEKEGVYGIKTTDNSRLSSLGLNDNYVLCIPVMVENEENAVKTLKMIYK